MHKGTGALITSWKLVSLFKGEPKISYYAEATGTLYVYEDRLEFKIRKAMHKEDNDSLLIYPLSQIAQLRLGKYGIVYNTLVVVLCDGTKISICPVTPGSSAPQAVIDSLKAYL